MANSPAVDAATNKTESEATRLGNSPSEGPPIWRAGDTGSTDKKAWDDYWEHLDDNQPIFVIEAQDYANRFANAFPNTAESRVLDFGCGFGFLSAAISPFVRDLVVWDGAANMRKIAYRRLSSLGNIEFADLSNSNNGQKIDPFDYILVNSVVQYMTHDDLFNWLIRWKSLLKTDGKLVVSDILLPEYSFFRDVMSYTWFCIKRGVLLQSIRTGLKEIGSYSSVKEERALLKLDTAVIEELADSAGLDVQTLATNLTYHHGRLTAIFTKPQE